MDRTKKITHIFIISNDKRIIGNDIYFEYIMNDKININYIYEYVLKHGYINYEFAHLHDSIIIDILIKHSKYIDISNNLIKIILERVPNLYLVDIIYTYDPEKNNKIIVTDDVYLNFKYSKYIINMKNIHKINNNIVDISIYKFTKNSILYIL